MPTKPPKSAVLFLVFNRPENTLQVFDVIRKAKPPRLYVAADGARVDREGEAELAARVREIATAVDWPCEVKTLFREENLGCGRAVKTAIDWFFGSETSGVILEDDTVPTLEFFQFCNELLIKYHEDQRVAMIAGTNHTGYKSDNDSYIFSKNKACWGWATWQRAWKNMDLDMVWRGLPQASSIKKNMGYTVRHYRHWQNALNAIDIGQVNAWDWQWYFSIAAQNQLTIFPNVNLVSNIGFGHDSTHTKGKIKKEYIRTGNLAFPLKHPKFLCPDFDFDEVFEKIKMDSSKGIKKYIPQSLKNILRAIFR